MLLAAARCRLLGPCANPSPALAAAAAPANTALRHAHHKQTPAAAAASNGASQATRALDLQQQQQPPTGPEPELTTHGFYIVRHTEMTVSDEPNPTGAKDKDAAAADDGSDPADNYSPVVTAPVKPPARVVLDAAATRKAHPAGDTIHTLMTGNGSPYQNIQARIMYATYKLAQKEPGGEKLTGFTRILHRSTLDDCADEVCGCW